MLKYARMETLVLSQQNQRVLKIASHPPSNEEAEKAESQSPRESYCLLEVSNSLLLPVSSIFHHTSYESDQSEMNKSAVPGSNDIRPKQMKGCVPHNAENCG